MSVTSELELSPKVQQYWRDRGYCVHGEVSVYGKAICIDHVAHTGPCCDPSYVVAIEMKRGSGKSLRRQLWKLDIYHVADEIWGATIATPREKTIDKWIDAYNGGRWMLPGLMSWNGDTFETHVEFEHHNEGSRFKMRTSALLLIDENKDALAGYPSGHVEHDLLTHRKVAKQRLFSWASREAPEFTTERCFASLPAVMDVYKKPRAAMNRFLRELTEEGKLKRAGKQGRYNKYACVKPADINTVMPKQSSGNDRDTRIPQTTVSSDTGKS